MEVIIVTGMSGAGKTKAADWLEDQGYYCIDNMPPKLIRNFLELSMATGVDKEAFVADVRGRDFFRDLENVIDELKRAEGVESKVIFVEAAVPTIVRRYNETRRRHPLTGGNATQAILEEELRLLAGVRRKADVIIDTTGMRVSEFNMTMSRTFLGQGDNPFALNLSSFGYKYGIPSEADMVVDVRFIPNPYYVKSLRKLTGNNKKVRDYVFKSDIANRFVEEYHHLINALIPRYLQEGKYHLNIAVGCTGGHHRSVAIANRLAEMFRADGCRVTLTHRDLDFVAKGDHGR